MPKNNKAQLHFREEKPVKRSLPPLLKLEDWWAVWLAFGAVVLALVGIIRSIPSIPRWSGNPLAVLPWETAIHLLLLGLGLALVTAVAVYATGQDARKYLASFPLVFLFSVLAFILGSQAVLRKYGFDNVVWALIIGLVVGNLFGKPAWLSRAAKTELFIKTGLVLLGAEILFNRIMALGLRGLGVAWLVTPLVFGFMYYCGTRLLKIDSKPLVATISAATAVCGVSAAIAAGAATRAKKEEISYAISLSVIFTILLMFLIPLGLKLIGIDQYVGGALIGGTIDTTGAVVVSGSMLGETAMEVASVIKMIQNVLIGIIAFVLSLVWVAGVEREAGGPKPSPLEIWRRFPKFILGFALASLLFSFVLVPSLGQAQVGGILEITRGLRGWLFGLAFVSIGLEANFAELLRLGRDKRSIGLYVAGQSFNIGLTFIAALLFFGGYV
jgi:uncharacterized integral membrane protein (TIGR00698 family)